VQQHVQQPQRLQPIAATTAVLANRPATSSHQTMGHWRAISPDAAGSLTVTDGASIAQLSAVKGPDLLYSQADSASSILVTRSTVQAQVSGHAGHGRLSRRRPDDGGGNALHRADERPTGYVASDEATKQPTVASARPSASPTSINHGVHRY